LTTRSDELLAFYQRAGFPADEAAALLRRAKRRGPSQARKCGGELGEAGESRRERERRSGRE
jgi:hypothetical protein